MTRPLVVLLLCVGVVVTAAMQIVWWRRPLRAPIFQPPDAQAAAPRDTTPLETRYAAAGPANAPIAAAAIAPSGVLVAIGGDDGVLRVWNAANGTRILTAAHSARDAASPELRDAPLVDVEISRKG